jgi:phosphatidylserine/phosphatidylglycerophosphate/cardiolipin synthase-like enzyme
MAQRDRARIVVTGTSWMGHGIGSVDTAMRNIIENARDGLDVAMYARSIAAVDQLDWVLAAAGRGVRVRFLVNRFENQPDIVRNRLLRLLAHSWCSLWDFSPDDEREDLHAKVVVGDRTSVLIGSTNLSDRGLLRNYEMGAVIEGTAAEEASRAIDVLLTDSRRVRQVTATTSGTVIPPV